MNTKNRKRVLLTGATGLVGRYCLDKLLWDPRIRQVVVLSRRPIDRVHPKLRVHEIDFDNLVGHAGLFEADTVICALGTTIGKAGDQETFERVDHDYVVRIADLAASRGIPGFVLVSAAGANPASRVFYNRIKGRTERMVEDMPFDRIDILRPSLLLGPRREHRKGEARARWWLNLIEPLLIGPWRRFRPVYAETVADLAVECAARDDAGTRVHYPSRWTPPE